MTSKGKWPCLSALLTGKLSHFSYPCLMSKKKPRLHKTLSMMILATL